MRVGSFTGVEAPDASLDVICFQDIDPDRFTVLSTQLPDHRAEHHKRSGNTFGYATFVRQSLLLLTDTAAFYRARRDDHAILCTLAWGTRRLGIANMRDLGTQERFELQCQLDPQLPWVICGASAWFAGHEVLTKNVFAPRFLCTPLGLAWPKRDVGTITNADWLAFMEASGAPPPPQFGAKDAAVAGVSLELFRSFYALCHALSAQ